MSQFSVPTAGKTSRENGASLDAKISYPKAAWGTQANIAKVKVKLPKQLPSRLTTLQKACTDKVFNMDPAACPVASRVGTVTTTTPVLPVSLNGPVYFVSHGAAKFPELIAVARATSDTRDPQDCEWHYAGSSCPCFISSSPRRSSGRCCARL